MTMCYGHSTGESEEEEDMMLEEGDPIAALIDRIGPSCCASFSPCCASLSPSFVLPFHVATPSFSCGHTLLSTSLPSSGKGCVATLVELLCSKSGGVLSSLVNIDEAPRTNINQAPRTT